MNNSRRLTHIVGAGLGALGLGGCPQPSMPPEACADPAEPTLSMANRGAERELSDGAQVEIFPPPQGGVFTELDIAIDGMAASELDYLRVTLDATDTDEQFAVVRYFGDAIPLRCTEQQRLELENLPVGFVEAYRLQDLDGRSATLRGVLETTQGDFEVRYDVTLFATEY